MAELIATREQAKRMIREYAYAVDVQGKSWQSYLDSAYDTYNGSIDRIAKLEAA